MKEGWKIVNLEEVCTKITDGSHNPPKGIDSSEFLMLSSQNVQNDFLDFSNVRYLSKEKFEIEDKRTNVAKGDVLLTIVGTIGRTCVVDTDSNLTFQRSVAVLKPTEEIHPRFLMFELQSLCEYLNTVAHGAAQKGIYLKQLKKIAIGIPPLSEQEEIVTYLDTAFAKIDAIKANAEKELEEAKKLFAAALNEAMTPKEGWVEKTLPDISENLDSRRKPVTKGKRETGIYPYYGASGIVDYVSDYIFDEDILLISEDGANLIARSTPIAFSISGKVWVNNHAHILKFKNLATQHFIEYYFASIKIDDYVTGAAQPKLNQKKLNSIPIWLPPLSDQHSIVTHLDTLSEKVRQLQSNYEKISSECDALKQAILRDTFE